jgi:uncharacterized membrane protein YjjB (DUF3815 family)
MNAMDPWWGVLWAALGTAACAVLFRVRGRDRPVAALGGALGWAVYLALRPAGSEGLAFFAAAAAVGLYAELAGRALRQPATVYLVCALLPLVPGGGMYYTMSESLAGNLAGTMSVGFAALSAAGAIAAGVAVSSAVARLAKRL